MTRHYFITRGFLLMFFILLGAALLITAILTKQVGSALYWIGAGIFSVAGLLLTALVLKAIRSRTR